MSFGMNHTFEYMVLTRIRAALCSNGFDGGAILTSWDDGYTKITGTLNGVKWSLTLPKNLTVNELADAIGEKFVEMREFEQPKKATK